MYKKHLKWAEKWRRKEVSFEGDQSPERDVVQYMEVRITLICVCVIFGKDHKDF
jgi:hypothetical protein